MATCSDSCINDGIKILTQIIEIIIQGDSSKNAPAIIQLLTNALVTFQCSLPPNVITTIKEQLKLLNDLAIKTVEQETIAYITIIAGTFIILTMFIYITMYMGDKNKNIIILFFILSIVVIIIAFAGLFLWLRSIFTSNSTQYGDILTSITDTLNKVITAGQNAFCCLGSCSICTTCPV
jgi:hypothetical protein